MTPEQELLSSVAKTVFRLNGQLLSIAEELAHPVGLTAAGWQVLGMVLNEPAPVADIARRLGLTRQSVQRVADRLVVHGLAQYRSNPAHRRAKLLVASEQGRAGVRDIGPAHAAFAERLAHKLGHDDLRDLAQSLARLSGALDALCDR